MKNSIHKKIQRQFSFGATAAALTVCIAAVLVIILIRANIIDTNEALGASAADDSKNALTLQMQESMLQLARSQSAISDNALASVARTIRSAASTAQALAASPELFHPHPIYYLNDLVANPAYRGLVMPQLRIFDHSDKEGLLAELADEIGLMAHISPTLIAGYKSLDYIRSIYLATATGINISVDADAFTKTLGPGDARTRPWFGAAQATGDLIWTDVIVDFSGRGTVIVSATPFYGPDGAFRGVVGTTMVLDVLVDLMLEARIGETGQSFIVNEHGDMIITDSVSIGEDGVAYTPNIHDLFPAGTAARILGGEEALEEILIDGEPWFVAYVPLNTLPWSLVKIMSVEEVIAPATESEYNIIGMTSEAVADIDRMIFVSMAVFAGAILLALAGATVLARRLASGLAKPVIELKKGAGIIGAGNLDYRLDVRTGDEIEFLADAFNIMIDNIKTITGEKERIGAELDVATRIQSSMLPCIFPAFPEHSEFDIYASMLPAKEVGGDFYDFFLINEETLAVVMADVSGKGVPAALFMVIAKTLLKNNAQYGKSPKEVFETVNNLLCENNEAGMFVTAFMGYLDIPSGTFIYVNAGHNPPLIRRSEGPFEWVKSKSGFVLAGMEDMNYTQGEVTLLPGDEIFLYTDGVTEAVNNENELFSDPKLLEVANKHHGLPLKDFTVAIKQEVDNFAEGAEQADDITMLALRYTGGIQ